MGLATTFSFMWMRCDIETTTEIVLQTIIVHQEEANNTTELHLSWNRKLSKTDVLKHSEDFCIVSTIIFSSVRRNYGSQCDRTDAPTESQFDRNKRHGQQVASEILIVSDQNFLNDGKILSNKCKIKKVNLCSEIYFKKRIRHGPCVSLRLNCDAVTHNYEKKILLTIQKSSLCFNTSVFDNFRFQLKCNSVVLLASS